jgi:hypothetical protein
MPLKPEASPTVKAAFESLCSRKQCTLEYRIPPHKNSYGCSISKIDARITLFRPSPGAFRPLAFILERRYLFWDKISSISGALQSGVTHLWRFYDGQKIEERLPRLSAEAESVLKRYSDQGAYSSDAELAAPFLQ